MPEVADGAARREHRDHRRDDEGEADADRDGERQDRAKASPERARVAPTPPHEREEAGNQHGSGVVLVDERGAEERAGGEREAARVSRALGGRSMQQQEAGGCGQADEHFALRAGAHPAEPPQAGSPRNRNASAATSPDPGGPRRRPSASSRSAVATATTRSAAGTTRSSGQIAQSTA